MRRLADYCVMLRDFKLAYTVYDILRSDFQNDKAWRYYAGACEMTALTSLLASVAAKGRETAIDTLLDAASYSYVTRCGSPFYALRLQAVAVELLQLRGPSFSDEAAKWGCRILEGGLVGSVGTVLFAERVAQCYNIRQGTGSGNWGSRRRKAALWSVLSAQRWLDLGQKARAAASVAHAWRLYHASPQEPDNVAFEGMRDYLILLTRSSAEQIVEELLAEEYDKADEDLAAEAADQVDETMETMGSVPLPVPSTPMHRRSGSSISLRHQRSQSTLKGHQRGNSTLSAFGDAFDSKTPVTPGSAGPKGLLSAEDLSLEGEKEKVDIRRHRMSVIGMDTGDGSAQSPRPSNEQQ